MISWDVDNCPLLLPVVNSWECESLGKEASQINVMYFKLRIYVCHLCVVANISIA